VSPELPRIEKSFQGQINFFPMADADDQNEESAILFLENDPVTADPQPEEILVRGEPLDVILEGFGIVSQYQQFLLDDSLVRLVDLFKIIQRSAEELDLIQS
jgi:hypothetical protein